MLQALQIFQVVFFTIPVVILVGMGVYILITPIGFIPRRWFLGVFLPFLLANPLAIIEDQLSEGASLTSDWRFWLILVADLTLAGIILRIYRSGWLVCGIDADQLVRQLAAYFEDHGRTVAIRQDQKQPLLGRLWEAQVIQVSESGQVHEIWIMTRDSEVRIQVETAVEASLVRRALIAIRQGERLTDFRLRAVGVLYIVLGLVIAFFGWIYFFEPRLILLE